MKFKIYVKHRETHYIGVPIGTPGGAWAHDSLSTVILLAVSAHHHTNHSTILAELIIKTLL